MSPYKRETERDLTHTEEVMRTQSREQFEDVNLGDRSDAATRPVMPEPPKLKEARNRA